MDLVLVDKQGRSVFVIVQRGKDLPQLSRAITCTGILARWKPSDFVRLLSESRRRELEGFLDVSSRDINQSQRGIVIAEDYDYEDLTATKWLKERHSMEIRCIRVTMAVDSLENEYLSCTDLSDWSLPLYRTMCFDEDEQTLTEVRAGGRRKHPRSGKYEAQHLKLNAEGWEIDAKLLNLSNGGMRVETPVPQPVDSDVTVSGKLYGESSCMELEASARVTHCISVDGDACRLGLSFQEVKYRRLDREALPAASLQDSLP